MSDEDEHVLLGYFPLYGATFDADDAGLLGGRALMYVPDVDEWQPLEQRDVGDELGLNVWRSEFKGVRAPLCVVVGVPIPEDAQADARVDYQIRRMMREGADAVLALRLYRSGFFLDPEMTMRVFRRDGFNIRRAGAYRQTSIQSPTNPGMAAYHLRLADLTTSGAPTTLNKLWDLVRRYRRRGRHAAEIPIDSFRFSYGYQLSATARAAFLFTALDAMLGGMSARRIDDVRLRSRFVDRLARALVLGGASNATARARAGWLDKEGRRIRNAIAHGRPSDVARDAQRADERLRSLVRSVLRAYLAHCIERGSAREGMATRPADGSSPVASFNRILDA